MSTDLRRLLESSSPTEDLGGASSGRSNRSVQIGIAISLLVIAGVAWGIGSYRGSRRDNVVHAAPVVTESAINVDPVVQPTAVNVGLVESKTEESKSDEVDQSHLLQPPPVLLVVTATPLPTATPTPEIIFVDRVVEIPASCPVVSCPTSVPTVDTWFGMAQHSVRICVGAVGVSGVWVDGVGMVHGGCIDLAAGVGSTQYQVQVNR